MVAVALIRSIAAAGIMFCKALLTLALTVILAASAQSAQLTSIQGDVLINRGHGYKAAGKGSVVSPGDRIQVLEGGSAQIVYNNGYVQTVGPGQVALVLANPPAPAAGNGASSSASEAGSESAFGVGNVSAQTLFVGGIALAGAGVGAETVIEDLRNYHNAKSATVLNLEAKSAPTSP